MFKAEMYYRIIYVFHQCQEDLQPPCIAKYYKSSWHWECHRHTESSLTLLLRQFVTNLQITSIDVNCAILEFRGPPVQGYSRVASLVEVGI